MSIVALLNAASMGILRAKLAMTTAVLIVLVAFVAVVGVIVWLLLGWRVAKPGPNADPAQGRPTAAPKPILNTDASGQTQLRLPERSTPVQLPSLISRVGPTTHQTGSSPPDRGPHPVYGERAEVSDGYASRSPGGSPDDCSDSVDETDV